MTPADLMKAAQERKAIAGFCFGWGRAPAAFVVGMPFKYVMDRLPRLKIYKPRTKKPK